MIEDIRKISVDYVTYNRIVQTGPALLFSLTASPDLGYSGIGWLLDGLTITSPKLLYLEIPQYTTLCLNYDTPLYFKNGIYACFFNGLQCMTLQTMKCF